MVTSLVCAMASSSGKAMSWSGSPSVFGALEAAVAAASSSRSVVAFKGIAVPAAKSLSVCRRDDDGVDIVQRGRRRRRGSSVQATAADAVKLDVSKATGSDSHNVSLNPKPCLPASLPSWFLSVDMKQANDVVQGRKHLNVVDGNEMLFSRHSNWMLTHGLHFIFGCSAKN